MTPKFPARKSGWIKVTAFKTRKRCPCNAFDAGLHARLISWVSTFGFMRNNCLVQICDGQLGPSFDSICVQRCHNCLFKKLILESAIGLQWTQQQATSRQNEHRKHTVWCLVAWRNNKLVLLQVRGNEKVLWSESLPFHIFQRTEVIILGMYLFYQWAISPVTVN